MRDGGEAAERHPGDEIRLGGVRVQQQGSQFVRKPRCGRSEAGRTAVALAHACAVVPADTRLGREGGLEPGSHALGRRSRLTLLDDDRRAAATDTFDVQAVAADVDLLPGGRRWRRQRRWRGWRFWDARHDLAIRGNPVSRISVRRVAPAAAGEPVASRPADEAVVARAADEEVVPRESVQPVVTALSVQASARAVPRSVSFPPVPGMTAAQIVPAHARAETPADTAIKCDFVNGTVRPYPLPWPGRYQRRTRCLLSFIARLARLEDPFLRRLSKALVVRLTPNA